MTLEDASKPMDVKVEETRRLAEKWDKHGSVPIPVEAKRLAQRSIAPSSMVRISFICPVRFLHAYLILTPYLQFSLCVLLD